MVQEPEDVDEHFVRNPSYVYRFCFFFTLECEGLGKALDDLGYDAVWYGAWVVCILRDVQTEE